MIRCNFNRFAIIANINMNHKFVNHPEDASTSTSHFVYSFTTAWPLSVSIFLRGVYHDCSLPTSHGKTINIHMHIINTVLKLNTCITMTKLAPPCDEQTHVVIVFTVIGSELLFIFSIV